MELRAYAGDDAAATLRIFQRAVRETARAHYSDRQVAAWADEAGELSSWAAVRAAIDTEVAVVEGRVVGFADLDEQGYVDMLFVDPDFGRRGIASALVGSAIARARDRGLLALSTFASLTSRPVFARHGFVVVGERTFGEGDAAALTYEMRLVLDPDRFDD